MEQWEWDGDMENAALTRLLEEESIAEDIDLDSEDVSSLLECLPPLQPDNSLSIAQELLDSDTLYQEHTDPGSPTLRIDDTVPLIPIRPEASAPSASKVSKQPRRSNSNKARNERREELLQLRQTVTQLEHDLAALRIHQGPPTALVSKRQRPNGSNQANPARLGPWETIAEHQRKERRRAEEENVRLRIELDQQLQFASRLERLVRQSLRQRTMEACGVGSGQLRANPPTFNDRAIYGALIRAMELRYQNIEAVYDRLGINDMEHSHHGSNVNRHEFGVEVEFFRNEVLPLSLEVASDAVWQHYAQNMARIPFRDYYERTRDVIFANDDMVLEHMGIKFRYNGKSAHFRVQQVLRRFVEPDRVVIMWCSNFHAVEYSDQPTMGTIFRRNGCMLFKRPTTLDPSELCVVKMSNVITPIIGGVGFSPDSAMAKKVAEFQLLEGTASAAITLQIIENMLLNQVLRRNQPSLVAS
ncbi:hypothetical protein Poli38472_000483 [Pythium oligandrum]|uniref:M96 mating-specific protein family n=1 Tax=Pythium oligandrum TaxID=41045 RepID=A0A8K1CBT8_PYTOL|nr:hypothetical protein Poli38472_000483 [Pythium oligandrum]|eukprot:TMW60441.1 hypothetical protein Poli38472_000483 [Pythium oligandrum]